MALLQRSWTVEELKSFLREHHLPVTGVKSELLKRVEDCYDTMFFEEEFGLVPFQVVLFGNELKITRELKLKFCVLSLQLLLS